MIELADTSIHIDATPGDVFELFTTEAGLCSWMAKTAAIDLRPGGKWRWVHDNDVAAAGEYVVIEPPARVVFTYGWESGRFADMAPGSTQVEVTFTPDDAGTTVRVQHHGVPAEFRDAHLGGWTYFLGLLRNIAHGDQVPAHRLPNTDSPDPDSPDTDSNDTEA